MCSTTQLDVYKGIIIVVPMSLLSIQHNPTLASLLFKRSQPIHLQPGRRHTAIYHPH